MESNTKDDNDLSEYKLLCHEWLKQRLAMKAKEQKEQPPVKVIKKSGLDLKDKLKIGKVNIVNPKNLRNEFYCSICDVLKHDSLSYQSHMTSKGHMKNIGKDLTVEKSTLAQVRSRLNGTSAGSSSKKNPGMIKKPVVPKKPRASKKQKQKEEEKPMTAEQAEMLRVMGFHNFIRTAPTKKT